MTRNLLVSSILVLVLTSCATAPAPSAPPPIWVGLTAGEFAVGFRTTYVITPPHPLQVSIWYPAESRGRAMRYRDYLLLSLTEKSAQPPTDVQIQAGIEEFTKFLTSAGLTAKSVHAIIDAPMYARLDAPSLANRRFPMVFIAQGNGQTAVAQAVLAEYLASHGYVVMTTPSVTRLSKPLEKVEQIGPRSVEQAEDIYRAVAAIAEWPNVAKVPVSLIGHSFGARGAMIYAMHHPSSALISLDGGIGTPNGVKSMLDLKEMDFTAAMPPVLHFYEMLDERMNPDFRMLRSLRTPKLELVRMNSMQHAHFTTDGFASAIFPELAQVTKAGPDLQKEVGSMAVQTLAFLDKAHSTR